MIAQFIHICLSKTFAQLCADSNEYRDHSPDRRYHGQLAAVLKEMLS